MFKYLYILSIIVLFTACRSTRTVQPITHAFDKKDTVQTVIIKEMPIIDSVAAVKELMSKIMHQAINFSTFNAKVKVEYEGSTESQNVTAYLSIIKDSIIYIQLKGFLGIIGMQAIITKDNVTIVNKIQDKFVQKRAISYLQELTEIPFTFNTLQDLLIGNPIFLDSNVVSYRSSTNNQLIVLMIGQLFKNLITLDKSSNLVLHCKLDDVNLQRNRTCDITFGNFISLDKFQFSTYRNISVSEKSKLKVILDFKEFNFNESLKYTFTIPKNYKRK